MVKNKVTVTLLIISVAANIYFLNKPSKQSAVVDKVDLSQAAIKKHEVQTSEKEGNLRGIKNSILEIKERDYSGLKETKIEQEKYINEDEVEKAQEAWKKMATDFMVGELDLDQNIIDEYFQLDRRREKALSEFMQNRINDNGGDQFFYTLEDIVNENKINEKFLGELKAMFGPQGYEEYKKFRNNYNRKIIESGEGFFLIEL